MSVSKEGNSSDIELVRDLVKSYIVRPSCLILLTVTCESKLRQVVGVLAVANSRCSGL